MKKIIIILLTTLVGIQSMDAFDPPTPHRSSDLELMHQYYYDNAKAFITIGCVSLFAYEYATKPLSRKFEEIETTNRAYNIAKSCIKEFNTYVPPITYALCTLGTLYYGLRKITLEPTSKKNLENMYIYPAMLGCTTTALSVFILNNIMACNNCQNNIDCQTHKYIPSWYKQYAIEITISLGILSLMTFAGIGIKKLMTI